MLIGIEEGLQTRQRSARALRRHMRFSCNSWDWTDKYGSEENKWVKMILEMSKPTTRRMVVLLCQKRRGEWIVIFGSGKGSSIFRHIKQDSNDKWTAEQQCLVQGDLGPGSGVSQDEGMFFGSACSPSAPEEGLQHSAHHHERGWPLEMFKHWKQKRWNNCCRAPTPTDER